MSLGLEPNQLRGVIDDVLRATRGLSTAGLEEQDDLFAKLGLNSVETFAVLVKLENALDIILGEDPSEFDRIRTLGGLESLLSEKVLIARQSEAAP